ncbi:MAG: hypothetical protein M0R06_24590 [Sphaerochaeta sp.]|jgi:hypothetical protein|nr:hypothetical protein [Sphaerochaeta sp.]
MTYDTDKNTAYKQQYRAKDRNRYNAQSRAYYQRHLETERMRKRAYAKKYRNKIKELMFQIYGHECACCGEKNLKFLTLDHVNGDGRIDLKRLGNQISILKDAVERPDKSKYQILCYNCNLGRYHNGGVCPHKDSLF